MIDDADSSLIERFADTLWMERGLSVNTLAAYQSEIKKIRRYLIEEHLGSLRQLYDYQREKLVALESMEI